MKVGCSNRKCGNEVEVPDDFEFEGCCSGFECGCGGLEINPVFCDECSKRYFAIENQVNESND